MTSLRLPRDVERDPRPDAVRAALAAGARRLWAGGTVEAAVVPLTEPVRTALGSPAIRNALIRGLEGAEATLVAERRGLDALPAADRAPRVSRLLLVTNDGAERLYRQVERLATTHAPRVLVCLLDVPSATLGGLLYGPDAVAKLVLTGHKDAATRLLLALAGPRNA